MKFALRHLGFVLLALCATRVFAAAAVPDHVSPALRKKLTRAVEQSTSFPNRFAAQVWLMDMSRRLTPGMPDVDRRLRLLRIVHRQAKKAGINPQLVLAVIQVESNFKRYAISPVGARGLMQIMPFWTREIGRPKDNLFEMQTNIRYGCAILAYYLDKSHGDQLRALARYNGSLGRYTYPIRVESVLQRHWAVN